MSRSRTTRSEEWGAGRSRALAGALLGLAMVGCETTTQPVHVATPVHMDESYDYTDLRNAAQVLTASILTREPLAARADQPVLIVFGITNRTDEHLDMKALTEKMQIQMLDSGKVRIIGSDQRENIMREIEYQGGGLISADTMIKVGRQLGAEYAISGSITAIEKQEGRGFRARRASLKYYRIHLDLTSLETALIEWADEYEFARETSRPVIGW